MKKILSITLAVMMLVSALALTAGAESYKPNGDEACKLVVDLKQANAANVVKDGVIGANEYERFDLSTDPSSTDTDLSICFGSSDYYEKAEAMCATMEYYFSWDTTNGFNFAVRYKPDKILQVLDIETDDPEGRPFDNFARQTAINFVGYYGVTRPNDDEIPNTLYYTIAKRTDTGAYLEGHWNQLGPTKAYDPEAGKDYAIAYSDDGYVTCEWSIPFAKMGVSGEVGTDVYFSISTTAGDELTEEEVEGSFSKCYAVSIGDYGFLCKASGEKNYATAVVNGEMIGDSEGGNAGGGNDPDVNDPDVNDPDVNDPDVNDPDVNDPDVNDPDVNDPEVNDPEVNDPEVNDPEVTDPDDNNNNKPTAPSTADAAVIAAVVSAVSAAGYAISKKRR